MINKDKIKQINSTLDIVKKLIHNLKSDMDDLIQSKEEVDHTKLKPVPLKESRSYTEDYMS